jgi:Phage integrase family
MQRKRRVFVQMEDFVAKVQLAARSIRTSGKPRRAWPTVPKVGRCLFVQSRRLFVLRQEELLPHRWRPDPENIGNQGAFLLGKASDAAERAPGLSTVQAIDPRQGIAAPTFYDQIKRFFEECAGVLRGQGDAKGAERFRKASTHWMRHSHASHAIAAGMPIEVAQQNLGHASLATTTVYVTTEKRRRMRAVELFWKR